MALAMAFYAATAAPGLTWAHHGADGGDLLAAAASNGVPHPTGYPLYTLLLQGWLTLGRLFPVATPARLGNLLSVLCAAASVGLTVATAAALLAPRPQIPARWLWAALAGLGWAVTPLLWSQAVITEVYALHALLVAAIGWALLSQPVRRVALVAALAMSAAHHVTSLLLWPAIAYWLWTGSSIQPGRSRRRQLLKLFALALLLAVLLYLRIPWVAAAAPPVNWGYADNLAGFWWLVSGAAYRGYFLDMSAADLAGRVAAWARVVTTQYTPAGLALALVGLADWDRRQPQLRTFSLLWLFPVSLYAIAYSTVDSEIYLLPLLWLAALWFANGLAIGVDWLAKIWPRLRPAPLIAALAIAGFGGLVAWRLPALTLRHDAEAEQYLAAAAATLEPGSLVLISADAETFALWYGVWGSGVLAAQVPDLVLVNASLNQFDWYRRLLVATYPDVPGIGQSITGLIAANQSDRPIYATEPLPELAGVLEAEGLFWRFSPPAQGQPATP
jgi:hypothetical protein